MVILVADRPNKVELKVNASIDISGFSAILAACGVIKTIDKLDTDNISFEYTAEEVARTSESGTYGMLIVYDANGKEYLKFKPFFQRVGSRYEFKAIGNQTIYITIVSTKKAEFADIENPQASVNSLQAWAFQVNNILRGGAYEGSDA